MLGELSAAGHDPRHPHAEDTCFPFQLDCKDCVTSLPWKPGVIRQLAQSQDFQECKHKLRFTVGPLRTRKISVRCSWVDWG